MGASACVRLLDTQDNPRRGLIVLERAERVVDRSERVDLGTCANRQTRGFRKEGPTVGAGVVRDRAQDPLAPNDGFR